MDSFLPTSVPTIKTMQREPAYASEQVRPYGSEPPPGMGKSLAWLVIRRWKRTILLAALGGLLTGALVSKLQSRRYTARATVEIQDVNNDFLNTKQVTPINDDTSANANVSDIQTQIQLLQSDTLLDQAVSEILASHPGSNDKQLRAEVDRIRKSLKVRALGMTRIIEMTAESKSPQLAADFLNRLSTDIMSRNVRLRLEMSEAIGGWLAKLLQKAQDRLRASETALQDYAKTHDLLFTSDNENVAEENLRQIQDELAKVQALRAEKQSRFETAKSKPAAGIPDVLNDSSLRQYANQLTDLKRQRAELAAIYTPDYVKIKRLDAEIASLESALKSEEGDILVRIQNEYQQAERRQSLLTTQLGQVSRNLSDVKQRSIQYDILKHEVDSNRQLYDSMLQRVKEATIASAIHPSNIHVIDPALPPKIPSYPKPILTCIFGLLIFLFGATLFAFVRERSDSTLKEPGDASFLLNLPELGTVRRMPERKALAAAPLSVKRSTRRWLRRSIGPNEQAYLLAESFRSIATSILFSAADGRSPRVVVFTSAGPAEGKTTLVANTGAALARSGRKVLLVEGDLRRNRLDQIFGLPNEFGLSTLLSDPATALKNVKATVQQTREPRLGVLTSGASAYDNPDLLYSSLLPKLLQQLGQEYDMILIDTPPLLEMPDARLLSRIADGVIFVVRARHTTVQAAIAAVERLSFDRAPVLGLVLNDWNPKESLRGYYGYYGRKLA